MHVTCPHCLRISRPAAFCRTCGHPLTPVTPPEPVSPTTQSWLYSPLLVPAILALAFSWLALLAGAGFGIYRWRAADHAARGPAVPAMAVATLPARSGPPATTTVARVARPPHESGIPVNALAERQERNRNLGREEFRALALGKTPQELLELFGPPGRTTDNGQRQSWYYFDTARDPLTGKRSALAHLSGDESGRVIEVHFN